MIKTVTENFHPTEIDQKARRIAVRKALKLDINRYEGKRENRIDELEAFGQIRLVYISVIEGLGAHEALRVPTIRISRAVLTDQKSMSRARVRGKIVSNSRLIRARTLLHAEEANVAVSCKHLIDVAGA